MGFQKNLTRHIDQNYNNPPNASLLFRIVGFSLSFEGCAGGWGCLVRSFLTISVYDDFQAL